MFKNKGLENYVFEKMLLDWNKYIYFLWPLVAELQVMITTTQKKKIK